MILPAQDLLGMVQTGWLIAGLVFLRVGAVLALLPVFGEQIVSVRIRLAAALAFTAIVLPSVAAPLGASLSAGNGLLRFLATETLAGLALGAALRLFVLALQTAGTIAAQATSLAQVFGIASVDPLPSLAHLLTFAGLALAAILGLHVKIAQLLIVSYDLFPPGILPLSSDLAAWGTRRVGETFRLAVAISAPFLTLSLLYNLALGAINRAMPQLMVSLVGAPAITAGAMILALLTFPAMLGAWQDGIDIFLSGPDR